MCDTYGFLAAMVSEGDPILDPDAGNSKSRGSRLLRHVLIAFVGLALLVLAAQAWLGTEIGRGVVESRLSAAFGRPVRVDGEFSIGIVPVPGASGTGLKLFTADGRWLVMDAGFFGARLALWPLLRGEVEVLALRLDEANVDLGRLSAEPGQGGATPGAYFSIPDIRRFQLRDVSLYFDGMGTQPHVQIAELSIDDFATDAAAHFEAEIHVVSEGGSLVEAAAEGDLTLWSGGVAEATLSRLDVALEGWRVRGFEGGFSADFLRSVMGVGLQLDPRDRPFRLGMILNWNPAFAGEAGGYLIEEVDIVSGEQRISGSGCLLDGEPPVLHATLSAQEVDLDPLRALVEEWRDAANGHREFLDADTGPAKSDDGLPVGLALRLELERARVGAAAAEGVVFRVGGRPDCPTALDDG